MGRNLKIRKPAGVLVLLCLQAQLAIAGNFQRPVASPHTIHQEYNAYDLVVDNHYHTGVDYSNSTLTARATSFGTVVRKQINGEGCSSGCNTAGCGCNDVGFGNTVILEHQLTNGQTIFSMYAHLGSFAPGLEIGSCLAPGDQVGTIGGSGYGLSDYWGTHLHFEFKSGNVLTNPSGSGTYFGYTPNGADNYGFQSPVLYILSPADQTAVDCTSSGNQPPNSFSKSSPAGGTGVTSYAVDFDWSSATDPDGDAVTYNLVVNDESGNSVQSCSVEGIASSRSTCTLPPQPNQNYYWQVWAVDDHGNSREASGGFWHVWTDTESNSPPNSFSKSSPPDGMGVTSFTVDFDWSSATDPDGDAVTYNLVVNDESGNSVQSCSDEWIASSRSTCTLPPQPNQNYYWQVWAVDEHGSSREALGGFWHVWTDTESNSPPNSFSKSSPTDGTGVTSLTVDFDWSSATDPDGDAVTYNLVVNDDSGNSVESCADSGLVDTRRRCILPQQANKDYYWQVWAVDEFGSSREASGTFWHLWTDVQEPQSTPVMLWKVSVPAPDARVTQLHGAYNDNSAFPNRTHVGVDISTEGTCGQTEVYPIAPGDVVAVFTADDGNADYLGNAVVIHHGSTDYSLYAHLHQAVTLRPNIDAVAADTILGTIGRSGLPATAGCHLHLEIRDFADPVYTGSDASCNNIYLCGDERREDYFLQHWSDSIQPRIGQFATSPEHTPVGPVKALPEGFDDSAFVPGWDVGNNAFSSAIMDVYLKYSDDDNGWFDGQFGRHLGVPHDNGGGAFVHCWSAPDENSSCVNGVWVQDLKQSYEPYQLGHGHSSIILNPSAGAAFLVKEGFWSAYQNHDGFQNLGAPSTDEEPHAGAPNFDNLGVIQKFESGGLYYHPDSQFDRTPPESDLITFLDDDMQSPISATEGWHIVGTDREEIDLYQNGNYLCTTPCTEMFSVDGWRYTISTPDVELSGVSVYPGVISGNLIGFEGEGKVSDSSVMLNNVHNFSYSANRGGGTIVLDIGWRKGKPYELAWNTFVGANSTEPGVSIALDEQGSTYVIGTSDHSWGLPVRDHSAQSDVFVVKYGSNGQYVWHTYLGGGERDRPGAIVARGERIFVAGESEGTWGSPVNDYSGDWDMFLAELDSSGTLVWSAFVGSETKNDYSEGLAIDSNLNLYLTGRAYASWGAPILDHSDNSDIAVAKFRASGELEWNTFLGASDFDAPSGIAAGMDGSIFVTGRSQGSWGNPIGAFAGSTSLVVAKLNNQGTMLWNTFLGVGSARGEDIAVDARGNSYVTGQSSESFGAPNNPHSGDRDILVAKLSPSGNVQWHTFTGGVDDDIGETIVIKGDREILIGARSETNWGAPREPHSGANDIALLQFSSEGLLDWHTFFGSAQPDTVKDMVLDDQGNLLITGEGQGAWGTPIDPHGGGRDTVILKAREIRKSYIFSDTFESQRSAF